MAYTNADSVRIAEAKIYGRFDKTIMEIGMCRIVIDGDVLDGFSFLTEFEVGGNMWGKGKSAQTPTKSQIGAIQLLEGESIRIMVNHDRNIELEVRDGILKYGAVEMKVSGPGRVLFIDRIGKVTSTSKTSQ